MSNPSTVMLIHGYVVERRTIRQLAERYGLHWTSVRERLLRAGVAMRRRGRRSAWQRS